MKLHVSIVSTLAEDAALLDEVLVQHASAPGFVPRAVVPVPSRNPRPLSMVLTPDGRALEARPAFQSVELTVFEEDGTTSSVYAPLPELEHFITVGETIVATFETTSSASSYSLGDIELGTDLRVVVGLDAQGQVLWHATSQRTLVEALAMRASDEHLAIAVRGAPGQRWSGDDGYEDLPVAEGTAVSYIMQLDPTTGRVLRHATHPSFALKSSMLATEDGVVMSMSDAGHLELSALSWEGEPQVAAYVRWNAFGPLQ